MNSAIQITQTAKQVLKDHEIDALPIDPILIAKNCDILVQPKPDTSSGVSGLLCRVGNNFGIMYATHVPSEGYQRFSVAHELGHYFLPGHIDAVLGINDTHESRAGFVSSDNYEREADQFAAELLMPENLFRRALKSCEDGLVGIEQLAMQCGASLTATAIRYTKFASIPVAIVVSSGHRVDFCFLSEAMNEFKGLNRLKKGELIPSRTLTSSFNSNPTNIEGAKKESSNGDLDDWFGGNFEVELYEEVVGLGSYGRTLTVLTTTTFADDLDEVDETKERRYPKWR